MKQIVIISRSEALRYLRSLDPGETIDLQGPEPLRKATAESAIEVITGMDPQLWAVAKERWKWTVGEFLREFGQSAGK